MKTYNKIFNAFNRAYLKQNLFDDITILEICQKRMFQHLHLSSL